MAFYSSQRYRLQDWKVLVGPYVGGGEGLGFCPREPNLEGMPLSPDFSNILVATLIEEAKG